MGTQLDVCKVHNVASSGLSACAGTVTRVEIVNSFVAPRGLLPTLCEPPPAPSKHRPAFRHGKFIGVFQNFIELDSSRTYSLIFQQRDFETRPRCCPGPSAAQSFLVWSSIPRDGRAAGSVSIHSGGIRDVSGPGPLQTRLPCRCMYKSLQEPRLPFLVGNTLDSL